MLERIAFFVYIDKCIFLLIFYYQTELAPIFVCV